MTDTIKTNGNGEPSPKEREIAAYLADKSDKLDASLAEVAQLKQNGEFKDLKIDALQSQLSETESRAASYRAECDNAVARRAELEAVLKSIQSVLRAFHISHEPLVREIPEEEVPTIGGA